MTKYPTTIRSIRRSKYIKDPGGHWTPWTLDFVFCGSRILLYDNKNSRAVVGPVAFPARPVSVAARQRRHLTMFLSATFFVALVAFAVYRLAIICYRVFFHPLRQIPGPKIAAITTLYESYHDLIKGGQFSIKVRELHRQYGCEAPVSRSRRND